MEKFANFSGLTRNNLKSQIYSYEKNNKVIALAKRYNVQNVTNDFIRVLGAQFTPSDANNHSKLLAELRCRMEKCAQRYRGLEYRARLLITNTFLITIPLFHLQYIPYLTANK